MRLGEKDFLDLVYANPANLALMERLPQLNLPGCTLAAGCLFQTVWNRRSGRDAHWGIKDYDVAYFDPDLSWEAEDAAIRRCEALVAPLGLKVELRNQARVHLWYEDRFGVPYPQLHSAEDGIDRYLIRCTKVGIRVSDGSVYAPEGLDDLWDGKLEINPLLPQPEQFMRKALDYQRRWDWLTVVPPIP